MAIQIVPTGGGTADADGISIPQTDLATYGVTAAEMTNDSTGLARAIWGVLKAVQAFDLSSSLGITKPTSPSVTNVSGLYDNRTYSLTIQKYVDFTDGSNGVVPLPSGGANAGVGGFALEDIFPNIAKVSATDAIATEAVLFATADLTAIDSGIVHGSLDVSAGQDNRDILSAMYESMGEILVVRDASTASAFTATNRGTLGLIATIPPAYIANTDPTSDLSSANASDGQIGLLSKSHSVTLQTEDDLSTDTIDVRVVTT